MRSDGWRLTEDLDDLLARAGGFLRSRPALHSTPLTTIEKLRLRGAETGGGEGALFGWLEAGGEVGAVFYRLADSRRANPTRLTPEQADSLAVLLAGAGRPLSGVTAEHDTAAAFAEAWERRTGSAVVFRQGLHLYRLGTLTPPEPFPEGRGRTVDSYHDEQTVHWCREFCVAVGEDSSIAAIDADSWADTRFADKHFTFWETPDGTPVSLAGSTSMVGGMVRVDPVYTPAHLRGHGYAAAVTVEVSRAALAAGATDVVLYTDPANRTSNALYQRLGYVRITDVSVYDFPQVTAEAD